jgi:uncharacterized protein
MKRTIIFTILALLLMAGEVPAVQYQEHHGGLVNDFAGVLSQEAKDRIESKARVHEKATGNEIAVVIVKDLQGVDIKEYSVKLFEKWGIGKKGKDNGILVLIATEEKGRAGGKGRRRIEVGYGLEGAVPDAVAGDILRKNRPLFDKGDIEGSTEGIVDDLLKVLEQKSAGPSPKAASEKKEEGGNPLSGLFILLIFVALALVVVIVITRRIKGSIDSGKEKRIEPPAPAQRRYGKTRSPAARTVPRTVIIPVEHERRRADDDIIRTTRIRDDEETHESPHEDSSHSDEGFSFGGGLSGGGGADD